MACHSYHPDTHTHGLADGCPRCDEHAEHPLQSLDTPNLSELIRRERNGLAPRSGNEARAMEALAVVRVQAERLGAA